MRIKNTIILALTVLLTTSFAAAAEKSASSKKVYPYIHSEDGPEFVSLFDGKTLDGWNAADMSWWSVEDGAITGTISEEKPCKDNQYLFCEVGEMADFELKMGHRILSDHNVNSGFQYRSEHYEGDDCKGYQIDNNIPDRVQLYDEFGRHTLASRGQRTVFDEKGNKTTTDIPEARGALWFDLTQWHEYHLICQGPKLTLYVNGRLVGEVTDNDPENQDLAGLLALQLHSGPPMKVQFKDIRWRKLDPNDRVELPAK
jgi:3-keto-disaccharide hydrolase